jgi:predicted phosphodiesterase
MKHRHIDGDQLTLVAIDSYISRGRESDWAELRARACKSEPALRNIISICRANLDNPYDSDNYQNWLDWAQDQLAEQGFPASTQRILFVGDCHGEFGPVREDGQDADLIILLGDQEPLRDLTEELGELAEKTWWIYGNHDSDYPSYIKFHQSMATRNLHCQVIEAGGVRIAGLGGTFFERVLGVDQLTRLSELGMVIPYDTRESLAKIRKNQVLVDHDMTIIFPEDLQALQAMQGVDILVTHEAPESHPLGFQIIGDLARAMGVKLLVHGHHHEFYRAKLDGGVHVVGVGVPGVKSHETRLDEGLWWL